MPDPSTPLRASQDQTGLSRLCPSCGRRVPRAVAACRCGATLPVDSSITETAFSEDPDRGSTTVIAIIVGALLFAAAGYWFLLRPAPPAATVAASAEEEPESDAAPIAATSEPSAAARAPLA